MVKAQKVGDINYVSPDYGEYKTSFYVTPKVKEYLKKEKLALACLLPNAWQFYECELFDYLDFSNNGKIDNKLSKEFKVLYNKITISKGWSESKGLTTEGFEEEVSIEKGKRILQYSGKKISTPHKPVKEFMANYMLIGDKKIADEHDKQLDKITKEADEEQGMSHHR